MLKLLFNNRGIKNFIINKSKLINQNLFSNKRILYNSNSNNNNNNNNLKKEKVGIFNLFYNNNKQVEPSPPPIKNEFISKKQKKTINELIKDIENNPKCKESYILLLKEMILNEIDEIEIQTYNCKIDNEPFSLNDSETKTTTTTETTSKYSKYVLSLIILDIDENDSVALDFISSHIINHLTNLYSNRKYITFLNGVKHPIENIICLNYLANEDNLASSYIKLIKINSFDLYVIDLLCEGLIKFPNDSSCFYFHLSEILKHNSQYLSIPNIQPKQHILSPKNLKMNRIQLIKKAIELLEQHQHQHQHQQQQQHQQQHQQQQQQRLLSSYYFKLGEFLESNKEKVSIFIKSIELDRNNSLAIKSLIKCMEPKQVVVIGKEEFNRESLCFELMKSDVASGCLLISKVYLQDSGENSLEEESKYYYNHYLYCKEEIRKQEIQRNSNLLLNYHILSNNLKDGESVLIDGKEMNNLDCLLKEIDLNSYNDYRKTSYYYQLSKYLKENNKSSTIKLLDGTILNKEQLLIDENGHFKRNSEALYSIYFENDFKNENLKLINKDDDFQRLVLLIDLLTMNPNFTKLYLEVGKILQDDTSKDDIELVFDSQVKLVNIKLNRKELFIKYLLLLDPIYPVMNNDTLDGWYHLSLELKNNETQFGKSKKQILLEILDFDKTYSKAYYQLSNLLENNQDEIKLLDGTKLNKIQLLLKSIDLERDYSESKGLFLFGLAKCLSNDKNDKIKLLDGRKIYNKQQLLIEIIEDYSNNLNVTRGMVVLNQELLKTYQDDNEIIIMNGYDYSKQDLLYTIEYCIKIKSNHSFLINPFSSSSFF